jgi:hypothetical protein
MPPEPQPTFAVEYFDQASRSQVIGSNLSLEEAVELARDEARQRRLGRMFAAGSAHPRDIIVITEGTPES